MNPAYMSTIPARRRRRSGMTLIEVMIAVFVLGTLFAAALSAIIQSSALVTASRHEMQATCRLNTLIEEVRARSFTEAAGLVTVTNQAFTDTNFAGTYSRSIVAVATNPDLLRLSVSVSWKDRSLARRIEAFTYVAKNGIVNKASATP